MSLNSRLSRAERLVAGTESESGADPIFQDYGVTGETFERMSKNLVTIFRKPNVRPIAEEQAEGRYPASTEPPSEHSRLSEMSLQDWYEAGITHILKYPHRLSFNPGQFGLENWIEKIRHSAITECEL